MKYDVIIEKVGSRKLSVISAIRILTDYSLQEAKEIVEGRSKIVMTGVSKEMAKKAKDELQKAGAYVKIVSYETFESKNNVPDTVTTEIQHENAASEVTAAKTAEVDDATQEVASTETNEVDAATTKNSASEPVITATREKASQPASSTTSKKEDQKAETEQYDTADKDLVEIIKNADREIKGCKIIKIITKILSIATLVISAIIFVISLLISGLLSIVFSFISFLISIISGGNILDALLPITESLGNIGESILDSLIVPVILLILFLCLIITPLGYIKQKIMLSHIKKNGYDKFKTLEVFMDNVNHDNVVVDAAFDIYPFLENTKGKITWAIKKIYNLIFVALFGLPPLLSIVGHRLFHIPFDFVIEIVLSMLDQSTDMTTILMYRSILAPIITIIYLLVVVSNANRINKFIKRKIRNIQLKKWL